MIEERAWEEFVQDMITNGRSVWHIRMVILNTRWHPFLSEIIDYARKLKKTVKFSNKKLKSENICYNINTMCIDCNEKDNCNDRYVKKNNLTKSERTE